MDRFGTLQLFTAVSLLGHVCHCWQARVPETVTAIRDSCVLVPCSTIPYSKVDWYKYKTVGYPVVYSNVQSEILEEFKGRTSVPGDARKGDCSLRINNVQMEDGEIDLYVWVFKPDGSHDGFEYHTTKINILNPTYPIITADSIQVDGKAFTAKCKFRTSCPTPPEMFWKGLDNISNKLIHTQNSDTLWYTEIIGTIIVSRKNQGARLSCTAKLNEQEYQSSSITLDVLYAPTNVRVDFTGRNTVVEGQSISLTCTSDCKPSPTDYEWVVNQNSNTKRHNGRTVVLNNVTRNTYVSCIVINSVGRGESKKLPLTVYYAPTDVRVDFTGSNTVVEGQSISLECTSNCKPSPTDYEWVVNQNNSTKRHNGRTVVLNNVTRNTYVSCIVINSVGRGESKELPLTVHYAPTDVRVDFRGKNTVVESQSISLACTSDCKPSPTDYEWVVNQNSTTKHYKGRTVLLQNVTRNTYVSCIAINSIGRGESKKLPLTVHYPPSILPGSFCSVSNRLLKCVCKAVAKPDAEISWTIDGSSTLSPALNTTTMLTDNVTVSELTGQWDDRGNIACTATNIAGSKVHQIDIDKWVESLVLVAGVGAACVCGILGVVTVIMICKKRRRAEPPTDLIAVQTVSSAKISQNKRLSFDEDLYVNAEQFEKKCKEQDAESCIYENYDKRH
ncbi:CD166 antigen homolog [Tachysurus fulvidraco]|uniref:CD166 antigen homolog n=1 Tax=Tachysurus fulvidraco TaxID=1234273 RepID=UPI000F502781|nr:CD166 antigen homolog [Tachysurus fulvidraco]